MKILDAKTWLAAILVLLAGLSAPATATARAKYSIKAEDWLFTEADKARVDALAQQAASRWNVIRDDATTRKFKEADLRWRAFFGHLGNVSGRLDIWKAGDLVSIKGYGGKQTFSYLRQIEFRERDTNLNKIFFAETRTLRCLQSQPDRNCTALGLEIWHFAQIPSGSLPLGTQLSVGSACVPAGKGGAVNWRGLSVGKCKSAAEKRPIVLKEGNGDDISITYPRLSGSGKIITDGMVELTATDGAGVLYFGVGSWDGARLEVEDHFWRSGGMDTVTENYVGLSSHPASKLGEQPTMQVVDLSETTFVINPFHAYGTRLDALCEKEWGTCVKNHIVGWEAEPDGRQRLDIDGCENGVCFKGAVYGTWTQPVDSQAGSAP